jgi:thioredoxin 1
MSDATDDIDDIRERKREELASELGTPDEPVHVDGQTDFRAAVADHHLALVDFYADWCGPCKMLEPTVETIAAETEAAVLKVDIDEHQALAREYNVQGVPTLYLFVDGEATEQLVGVQDEATLRDLIERYS